MNYYERHLGDYARDTGHLTLLEHGVYTVLLDRYYATEEGIPADQAHRIARARTDEERAAVDAVLAEFFVLIENRWVSGRVEQELESARDRIEKARLNGKKGGRPTQNGQKKTGMKPEANPEETQPFNSGSEKETQTKAHQAPSIHLSVANATGAAAPAEPDADPIWGTGLAFLIRKGVPMKPARSLLGQLRKTCGDAETCLLLLEAEGQDITNPAPWLMAAAGKRSRAGPTAAPSKTLSAVETLQRMKTNGRVDPQRDSGRTEPLALPEPGADPGGRHDPRHGHGMG